MRLHTFSPNEPYTDVLERQETAHAHLLATGEEALFIGEHPPTITLGSSARTVDVFTPDGFDVIKTGRGGQVTLHSPRQLVAYPILDLTRRGRDVRTYVQALQNAVVQTLQNFNINAHGDAENIGVWVPTPASDAKIAAIGIRVRKWATLHGVALNVANDLTLYKNIVPCGLDKPITSLQALGCTVDMAEVRTAFTQHLLAL